MKITYICSVIILSLCIFSCNEPGERVWTTPVLIVRDFTLPATSYLKYSFFEEGIQSDVFACNLPLNEVEKSFQDSMIQANYTLNEKKVVDDENIILTYQKSDKKVSISILDIPTDGSKSTFVILHGSS